MTLILQNLAKFYCSRSLRAFATKPSRSLDFVCKTKEAMHEQRRNGFLDLPLAAGLNVLCILLLNLQSTVSIYTSWRSAKTKILFSLCQLYSYALPIGINRKEVFFMLFSELRLLAVRAHTFNAFTLRRKVCYSLKVIWFLRAGHSSLITCRILTKNNLRSIVKSYREPQKRICEAIVIPVDNKLKQICCGLTTTQKTEVQCWRQLNFLVYEAIVDNNVILLSFFSAYVCLFSY